MQLQQLVYFLAVARTRHFTRAAELTHVAQPSLSKQIHCLERELDSELFHRARGNVTLTPAGEVLVPFAKRILADVETARLQVHELAELRQGRLRLGATPSLCTGPLAHALAGFHVRYPGIQLVIDESGSRDLVRQLAEGAIDLAMITSPVHRRDPTLDTVPILREQLTVAVPRTMGLDLDSFRIEDLRDRPLVMFREGYDLRSMTLTACQRAGFQPRFAIEGGEMDAVLSFVEAGLGIAVVPSMVLQGRTQLRGVPFVPPTPIRTIALAHRTDVRPTRAAEEFRTTLVQLFSDAHAQGRLPAGVEFIAPVGAPSAQSRRGSTSVEQSSGPSSSRTTRHANSSE
ncbi:MAG: LysR family transcriptional regulator [Pseudonocardiales bacterium]|nr:LysR family transcriptional regulator [Pseudonocardiales bacterium]MBV9728635.1 LysR family transcriptional regulator [Pseudonocardiales bacterium]